MTLAAINWLNISINLLLVIQMDEVFKALSFEGRDREAERTLPSRVNPLEAAIRDSQDAKQIRRADKKVIPLWRR